MTARTDGGESVRGGRLSAGARGITLNPIIYAEVSARFERIEDLDDALPATY